MKEKSKLGKLKYGIKALFGEKLSDKNSKHAACLEHSGTKRKPVFLMCPV